MQEFRSLKPVLECARDTKRTTKSQIGLNIKYEFSL